MKRRLLLLLGFCLTLGLSAQIHKNNLVIDGSFNERNDLACHHPNDVPNYTKYWYRSIGSADFFVKDCPYYRDFLTHIFWSPHEGRSYIGLAASARYTGFFNAEAIGTELKEPLKPGLFYYFEAEIEDKGVWLEGSYPLQDCPITPEKKIIIGFSEDSILTDEQYIDPYITFDDTAITSHFHNEWKLYSDCFQAKGGEKHMGMGWVRTEFEIDTPCTPFDPYGMYFAAYAYMDEIRVQEIADVLRDTVGFCIREFETTFDPHVLLEGMELGEVKYEWEDGYPSVIRTFNRPGTYRLTAEVPCGTIPGEVIVQEKDCRVFFYVPSGFSPNGDLQNDLLVPTLRTDVNVTRFQFRIFDRWGRMVKEITRVGENWDGTFNGKLLPPGVYVWEAVMTLDREGEFLAERENGTITLIH